MTRRIRWMMRTAMRNKDTDDEDPALSPSPSGHCH
jgi:hypothetical protein